MSWKRVCKITDDVIVFIGKELVYQFEDEDDTADDDFFNKA